MTTPSRTCRCRPPRSRSPSWTWAPRRGATPSASWRPSSRGCGGAPTSPFRRSTATWPATTSTSCSPTWRRPGAPASLPRVFTPVRWGARSTARCCRPARSTSPPASTPFIGSTGCPRSPCPISSPTAGRFRRDQDSPCRRRPRLPSRDRPSRTWSGSWNAVPGSWSRGASCCWPAPGDTDQARVCDGLLTSSTTPVSTWSPPAGWNERSMNA